MECRARVISRRRLFAGFIAAFSFLITAKDLAGQTRSTPRKTVATKAAPAESVSAILMSDIHFDPFRDPAKAERLAAAQEGEWNGILREENSPNQKEAFDALQKTCHETSVDTPYSLLQSSLAAMKAKAPDARFALVSGDLVVHSLACRFHTLLPGKSEEDYKAFVAKLTRYVLNQTRLSLKGVQIYAALGNNDNACRDYAIDPADNYFHETRAAVLDWLPPGPERQSAFADYSQMGDYAVTMAAPMQRTRLIVLDDLFQSRRYLDCSGKPNPAAVDAQLAWLEKELAGAKRRGERVWVLGHIPPGLDSYATLLQHKNICAGEQPVMFLATERMQDVMAKYADVIPLGVFGHSHMDEMRLFGGNEDSGTTLPGPQGKVAIKMVPSITPLASGVPQFIVAKVDTGTARMTDYTVYAASNATGVDADWSKVYSYGEAYHLADFSPAALDGLIQGFEADPAAGDTKSSDYLKHIVGGEKAMMLRILWPSYACVMEHHTAKSYAACFCPATK